MHLSLQQKELFFHDLGQLLRAGKSLAQALELKSRGRATASRKVASAMAERGDGSSAEAYFAAVPEVFSELDREIVRGGELSGQLTGTMDYLAGYYGTLARTQRRIAAQCAYPIFILHFGALLLSLPAFMSGGVEAFVWAVAKFLGFFYIVAGLGWLVFLAVLRAARETPSADRFLQSLPVIGGVRTALVGSRFCMLMGILIKASGSILSAMNRASAGSGSALFRRGSDEVVRTVQGGGVLSVAVAETRAFPEDIDRVFQTGEASGRLDEEMQLQAGRYTELFQDRIALLSGAFSKLVYIAIAMVLAYHILSFYFGYYSMAAGMIDNM